MTSLNNKNEFKYMTKIQQRNESECDMEKECCLLAI